MTKDQLSDMLTRIRNASLVFHNFVYINYTELNLRILKVLKRQGYVKDYSKVSYSLIKVFLKYKGWWLKKPVFSLLVRISKPGFKQFCGYKKFIKVLNSLRYNNGLAFISTSLGIITHKKALFLKRGGELLFYIE